MRRWGRFGILLLVAMIAWIPAWAGDLVIYDDALQNSFVDNSYTIPSVTVDFASIAQVHSGTHSIAFTANGNDAVKLANNAQLFDTASYPRLHFWFYGSSAQCQGLDIILQRNNAGNDVNVASGALSAYATCNAIVNGQWLEITADFTASPMSYNSTYDRISLFNHNGAAFGPVYFDDLSLFAPPPANDLIFENDFENHSLPPPLCGVIDQKWVTVGSMVSDNFTWCDSAGQHRSAALAHNDDPAGPGGSRGGDLREFRYETVGGTRVVSAPARDHGGFGYIVSHSLTNIAGCDDSDLGHLSPGTSWTLVFEGRHHAIFRFQQNYRRYCTLNGPAHTYYVPVTIDWIFSSGRDNPVWAITYDMQGSGAAADVLADDSRAPYGTMNIDGSTGLYMDNDIAGVSWGDRYAYSTTTSPATPSSSWTWSGANTVPFVDLWTVGADASMGLAQTQTMDQQDAGGGRQPYGAGTYDVSSYWGKTSGDGQACPNGAYDQQLGLAHNVPCLGYWPYQLVSFNYYLNITQTTNDAQMTWGTQYGFLGQSAYDLHDKTLPPGSTASGYPKKSYSVYIVLGPHSTGPVAAQVGQVETAQTLTLSAAIGSVVSNGPAGVNRADTVNYVPAGYNHVYGALAFAASVGNQLDANIAVGSGTLKKPLLILNNYGSGYPTSVKLNGTALMVDVDYFPSLRVGANELWITFNGDLSGPNNLIQIIP